MSLPRYQQDSMDLTVPRSVTQAGEREAVRSRIGRSDLPALVDSIVEQRVIVYGSLPPAGRDLDLLVHPDADAQLSSLLPEFGFVRRGSVFARFASQPPDAIDIKPARTLGLPEAELLRLFAEARVMPGAADVAMPSPHHTLLFLASKALLHRGPLSLAQRSRVEAALAEDPDAFETAEERAGDWRLRDALILMRASFWSDRPPSGWRRALALREANGVRGLRSAVSVPPLLRGALRPSRRGTVVALSGLDGCGKSSQALRMRDSFDRLDVDAAVAWHSLLSAPPLLTEAAKHANRLGVMILSPKGTSAESGDDLERPTSQNQSPTRSGTPVTDDPTREGRLSRLGGWRGTAVANAWSMVLAANLAQAVARSLWPQILRGKTVICDRYWLDAEVELRYFYGSSRTFSVQMGLLRLLTPAPGCSYLLEVDPRIAAGRKDEYSARQNKRRAELYDRLANPAGVARVDGSRRLEEVTEELCARYWSSDT